MLFFSIIVFSIITPYIFSKEYKNVGLLLSALSLFILWGFQYETTQDWTPHLNYWYVLNMNASSSLLQRDVELIYKSIIQICKPIGFFGFLIVSGAIQLSILFSLIKKNVSPNYYWAAVAVLMLLTENGLLIINSNRQSWALIFTITGTMILFDNIKVVKMKIIDNELIRTLLCFSFYFFAFFIHGGALVSLGLILIYYLAKKIQALDSGITIILFNFLFFSRFVIDASQIQQLAYLSYANTGLDNFDKYITEIAKEEHLSTVFNILYFIYMNTILIMYKKMTAFFKFVSLCVFVKILLGAFLTGNIQRVLQYYCIYDIILVPYIFQLLSDNRIQFPKLYSIRFILCYLSLSLVTYDFLKRVLTDYCYDRWPNFRTIFEAPIWI